MLDLAHRPQAGLGAGAPRALPGRREHAPIARCCCACRAWACAAVDRLIAVRRQQAAAAGGRAAALPRRRQGASRSSSPPTGRRARWPTPPNCAVAAERRRAAPAEPVLMPSRHASAPRPISPAGARRRGSCGWPAWRRTTVLWRVGERTICSPTAGNTPARPPTAGAFTVPRAFLELAADVVLHRVAGAVRPALPAALAAEGRAAAAGRSPPIRTSPTPATWPAQVAPRLAQDARLRALPRVLEGAEPETYVAWFEPPHRVLERTAPLLRAPLRQHALLDPDAGRLRCHWDGAALSFTPGADTARRAGEDALEDDWRTYYASIFNPARLKSRRCSQRDAQALLAEPARGRAHSRPDRGRAERGRTTMVASANRPSRAGATPRPSRRRLPSPTPAELA